MKLGSKLRRYFASRAGTSRPGSTVTYTTWTSAAAPPSLRWVTANVFKVVGHTSVQEVKPNASSTTLPRYWLIFSSWPSEPASEKSGANLGGSKTPAFNAGSLAGAAEATNMSTRAATVRMNVDMRRLTTV